ncbi:MAG: TIGR01777 family oxidoreductase, partial [Planctomycetaceae bacterium]
FLNADLLEGVDAVVHLAGESIATGRWSDQKKHRIKHSRIAGTRTLCEALAAMERKPEVLVCASATGFYGDRGDELLTEDSAPGEGFLVDVCQGWEEATAAASNAGIRVVNIRIGVVLDKQGGALAAMLMPFKMGVGGKIGSGKQYWSWITLTDLVRAIDHCICTESLNGPVNAVSPNPSTNTEFTKAMGKALGRPTIFPLPGFMAKLVLGQMAEDLLLASARVVPNRLRESGFEFKYSDLNAALTHALE